MRQDRVSAGFVKVNVRYLKTFMDINGRGHEEMNQNEFVIKTKTIRSEKETFQKENKFTYPTGRYLFLF